MTRRFYGLPYRGKAACARELVAVLPAGGTLYDLFMGGGLGH